METVLIFIVSLLVFYVLQTLLLRDLSVEKARHLIQEGAMVIDVRTEDEYQNSHIEKVMNIPLRDIETRIRGTAPDRGRVILLHCRTGKRSFWGKKMLKKMGYKNVFNLGSFGRAKKIVGRS